MLDFSTAQKKFLSVKLIDGNTIFVRMPTKKIFDSLNQLGEKLDSLKLNDTAGITEIYDLMTEILSNNKQGKEISNEYLSGILDIEDIEILFHSYIEFVSGSTNSPNLESPHATETNPSGITNAEPNGNG